MDAKTWNCRPSDLLAIEDEYAAYCLDQAVGYFGRTLQAELDSVDEKDASTTEHKRRMILERYLGDKEKPARGLFADPAAMFT